ncbi:MAG: peptidoglycan DD-metalloendopeptidase family protein [Alphaproteobacteria bacterium]
MRRHILFFLAAVLFLPLPATAESTIGQKLKQHEAKKENLEQEIREIEKDLGGTRNELVSVSKSIQANEKALQTLEGRIEELEAEKKEIKTTLENDRKSMADLILALERIRRVPPEAMIARPDAPFRTAQSALLMGDIIPSLHKKAEALKVNLANLDRISDDLEQKREKEKKAAVQLAGEQQKLSGLVDKREKLFADTHADLETEKVNVKRISQQARNLADLVTRLDHDRTQRKPDKKVVSVPSGNSRLPISGIVRTRYDEPDNFGAPSKGVSIEGREGALVVAPMGGIVRFAGHFRNYGNIVILEHEKGYHSLVAGLEKIDTVVGQSVSAGEPLGLLHRAENPGGKPALYYELRLNGRPVNPATKFAGLG